MPGNWLSLNGGVQDPLLQNANTSLFASVGYQRVANFMTDIRDVDPQNTMGFGREVQFVIPKSGDLLGHMDLKLTIKNSSVVLGDESMAYYCDCLGFACIDEVQFQVGTNLIERIHGEWLHIENELYTGSQRKLTDLIDRIGAEAEATIESSLLKAAKWAGADQASASHAPLMGHTTASGAVQQERTLFVPLGLHFTKHPSQYLKLAAISAQNDVRIVIKFRPILELLRLKGTTSALESSPPTMTACQLRCHYVHVTGPEAAGLLATEHVNLFHTKQRLSRQPITFKSGGSSSLDVNLSFLHPIKALFFTFRHDDTTAGVDGPSNKDSRSYFSYLGKPQYPASSHNGTEFQGVKLILNGQEKHGIEGGSVGMDRKYIKQRLMADLHSKSHNGQGDNIHQIIEQLGGLVVTGGTDSGSAITDLTTADLSHIPRETDSEIYTVPFSLHPENLNPSGSVNFSKVSHAVMRIFYKNDTSTDKQLFLDIYALGYNWVSYKAGKATLSFA